MFKTFYLSNFFPIVAFLLVTLALFGTITPRADAQLRGDINSITLQVRSTTITPYSRVPVALDANGVDMIGATITWFVDDKEIVAEKNNRSIMVETGKIGTVQKVKAVVTRPGKTTVTATLELTPSVVDIVIESDGYIPSFYEGRALPSTGSTVRVIAIPITSAKADPKSYSYTWKRNGSMIFSGPAMGRQVAEFTLSDFRNETIEVIVHDDRGNEVGKNLVETRTVKPELQFYEVNPLRGVTGRALTGREPLIGDEIRIQAETYFINPKETARETSYAWSIDNRQIATPTDNPRAISLERSETPGAAQIELRVVTGDKIPTILTNSFSLFFD